MNPTAPNGVSSQNQDEGAAAPAPARTRDMARKPKETVPAERPSPEAPEHERAQWWRVHVARLSRPALSEMIGKSPSYVQRMEEGEINGRAIEPEEYKSYRLACAAITAGVVFNWLDATIEIAPGVTVTRTVPPPDEDAKL